MNEGEGRQTPLSHAPRNPRNPPPPAPATPPFPPLVAHALDALGRGGQHLAQSQRADVRG